MATPIYDSHTHSDNSPDGYHSVTFLCENAIEKGMAGFALTDHCDINVYFQDKYDKTIRQSNFEMMKAKSIFSDRLELSAGVELGQPLQALENAEQVLASYDFDFVICSLHNNLNQQDYYFINYNDPELDIKDLFDRYFQELLETIAWGKFDVLGHLTYPLRYMNGIYKKNYSFLDHYYDEIVAVMKGVIQQGKGIEINTSGLRQPVGVTLPDLPYIKLYKQLGGEILTIGSDSHTAQDIGAGIADGILIAKEAGFDYYTFFQDRKPKMIKID